MIKEWIESLDAAITDKGLIESWGGMSVQYENEGKQYGRSFKDGCKGNVYGSNTVFGSEGYMHIKDNIRTIESNRLLKQVDVRLHIELFCNHKLLGEEWPSYKKGMEVISWLSMNKYQAEVIESKLIDQDVEHVVIEVTHQPWIGCSEVVYNPAIDC